MVSLAFLHYNSMLIIQCHSKIFAEINPPSTSPQIQAQNISTTIAAKSPPAALTMFVIFDLLSACYGIEQNSANIDQPITHPGALKYSSATIKQQIPHTASPLPFRSIIFFLPF